MSTYVAPPRPLSSDQWAQVLETAVATGREIGYITALRDDQAGRLRLTRLKDEASGPRSIDLRLVREQSGLVRLQITTNTTPEAEADRDRIWRAVEAALR